MQNTLLIGLSRQVALQRELDVVSNNIANMNTTGYKADGAIFEEFLSPTARAAETGNRISFVHDRATWHDLGQGTVEQTGNPLDVAVQGNGFFVVQTPRGERYTRNGALQLNANGELVTASGYPVLGDSGPIRFQPTDRNIMIAQDGTVSVQEGSQSQASSLRGRLRVVNFNRPQQLQKDGDGSFSASANNAPQPDTQSRILQGSIEKSNVRSVVEMTRMIEVTRSYSQVAAMLQQQGDMRQSAIQKLADVPA
ncbi:MAG: flagellar basal-body rod protein FlgF [Rhizobiales bacterium]|nr:flagellar basal-body rod protein FlgF [Hyphomicrobiales bacterium]OJY43101.1 MAG: flagellar basal-body rod protein FlgF [Rhizobiales bacterium 64-17]